MSSKPQKKKPGRAPPPTHSPPPPQSPPPHPEGSGEGEPPCASTRPRKRIPAALADSISLRISIEGQGHELPDPRTVHLPKIDQALKLGHGYGNFNKWLENVHKTLTTAKLQNLVSVGLLRPPVLSKLGEEWEQLSKMVKAWLERSLGPELRQKIIDENDGLDLTYADIYYEAIRRSVGQG
ncbi:hypothetical protein N7456_007741 [Penicillium angulare]|uniref:Uncharacterized protein n=1 Tax=Penicillium angulare TaxID=116970 RepID=A0A9W9K8N7_9EURO|nr:hypothetical protein N7456_007741 [Penicillium angulare]